MDRKEIKMKAFDLEKAKNGGQVYTRDGRKVQILDYNYKYRYLSDGVVRSAIVGKIIINSKTEELKVWTINGFAQENEVRHHSDLVMDSERHDGWINIYNNGDYKCGQGVYPSKEIAEAKGKEYGSYVATVKVRWKE
jgi:hypothetical protein